ncbi:TonB-dependent receptor [Neolewinella lacunae]|uniref:TonB-dependent receptor n=1 Tax=Neolewinella lacunae TaxID=1517758 RepID=A0A923PEI8_9BACT|nr:TonB-dependent receptor [Neolewinella lacunae]MBC6992648.1 TonB-dependent receptor [Neolewinella lacunae]MDN3633528.1 TonB-dependent receptor [Neolewinella lacunae]
MKHFLCLALVTLLCTCVSAQEALTLDLKRTAITRTEALRTINDGLPVTIFFQEDQVPKGAIDLDLRQATVREALDAILKGTLLDFIDYRERIFVVGPAITIGTEFDAAYYAAVAARTAAPPTREGQEGPAYIGALETLETDGLATVKGQVTDQQSGETFIGATIQVENSTTAAVTDAEGNYELRLRPGDYTLVISYVGFGTNLRPVRVQGSGTFDIALGASATNLTEIVVTEQAVDANVGRVQAGVQRLDMAQLEKLPTFMGETDVVKALLLNPGVSSIGEGASGFNVRGGEIDQNLLLMDNGALINSSHALGFFSTYNADLIKSVDLYKANIPARFGGRLASVLDVQMRDGNFERHRVKAGIGPVTGRIMVEGPIVKDQSSFIFGARSSYANWAIKLASVEEVKNSATFFFDGNLRLTQRIGDKSTLILQGYGSQDEFNYNNTFAFDYGTVMGQATWKQIFSDQFYADFSLVYNDYQSSQSDLRSLTAEVVNNGIRYLTVKPTFFYEASKDLQLQGGLDINQFWVNPGDRSPATPESLTPGQALEEEQGMEASLFASADYTVSNRFSISGGLRFTNYRFLGPGTEFQYEDGVPRRGRLTDSIRYGAGEVMAAYNSLQPRVSLRFRLNANASIRGGYSRTAQFLNQIFVSDSPTPSSQYQLSTTYIPPFLSHNFSLGYFLNQEDNNIELGAEVYGRRIDQLWDYRDFAEVIVNPTLETEILIGEGRAYGLELSAKRKVGVLNGLVSYTFSSTQRKIAGINNGNYYNSNFDKPHNFVTTINWNPNQRNTLTANFTYRTGRPVTAPVGNYRVENGLTVPVYSDRNAVRIPDYHRLDLAYTLGKGYNKTKNFQTSWTISLYNVYGRRNAFSVFYTQAPDQTNVANQLAVLGTVFPAVTFNIETR